MKEEQGSREIDWQVLVIKYFVVAIINFALIYMDIYQGTENIPREN